MLRGKNLSPRLNAEGNAIGGMFARGKKKVGSSNKEQKLNCVKCHQMMWKNPHVFKYAAQYGLRTHFASDVRMVSTSPALKCECACVSRVDLSV